MLESGRRDGDRWPQDDGGALLRQERMDGDCWLLSAEFGDCLCREVGG
jgi:hypothetical protein